MGQDYVSVDPAGGAAPRLHVDPGRLWAGGAATALVAALAAAVTVLVETVVLDLHPVVPGWLLGDGSRATLTTRFALTAAVAGLLATGLLQLLLALVPRPRAFFGWVVALATVAAAVVPFAVDGSVEDRLATSVVALLTGVLVGSLLSGVVGRGVWSTW